jgi:hypothetical protein
LALARPQFVEPPIEKTEPQRDILLALDLSQSMDTKDFRAPSGTLERRVEAVRQVVSDFVAKRTGERLGLIAFGDPPYPLAPFTMDHELVRTMAERLLPGIAGRSRDQGYGTLEDWTNDGPRDLRLQVDPLSRSLFQSEDSRVDRHVLQKSIDFQRAGSVMSSEVLPPLNPSDQQR